MFGRRVSALVFIRSSNDRMQLWVAVTLYLNPYAVQDCRRIHVSRKKCAYKEQQTQIGSITLAQ